MLYYNGLALANTFSLPTPLGSLEELIMNVCKTYCHLGPMCLLETVELRRAMHSKGGQRM